MPYKRRSLASPFRELRPSSRALTINIKGKSEKGEGKRGRPERESGQDQGQSLDARKNLFLSVFNEFMKLRRKQTNLFLSRKKFSEDWAVTDKTIYLRKMSRDKTFLGRLQRPSNCKAYLVGNIIREKFPFKDSNVPSRSGRLLKRSDQNLRQIRLRHTEFCRRVR